VQVNLSFISDWLEAYYPKHDGPNEVSAVNSIISGRIARHNFPEKISLTGVSYGPVGTNPKSATAKNAICAVATGGLSVVFGFGPSSMNCNHTIKCCNNEQHKDFGKNWTPSHSVSGTLCSKANTGDLTVSLKQLPDEEAFDAYVKSLEFSAFSQVLPLFLPRLEELKTIADSCPLCRLRSNGFYLNPKSASILGRISLFSIDNLSKAIDLLGKDDCPLPSKDEILEVLMMIKDVMFKGMESGAQRLRWYREEEMSTIIEYVYPDLLPIFMFFGGDNAL